MITHCPNCKPHPFQDSTYGPNMRVHNLMQSGSNVIGRRCTVCLATVKSSNQETKDKKVTK